MKENRDLFWSLVEPEHLKARSFCRKLMGNRDDGDDLYQDALVTAFVKFDRLRAHESIRPWLYRIIVNTFKNTVRSPWWKRRRRFVEGVGVGSRGRQVTPTVGGQDLTERVKGGCQARLGGEPGSPDSTDTDPRAVYAARRRLEVAFRAVSAHDRVLVTLFELEGWTSAELAGLFGKSEASVKMRLSRARQKMRKALVKRMGRAEQVVGSGQTGTSAAHKVVVAVRSHPPSAGKT